MADEEDKYSTPSSEGEETIALSVGSEDTPLITKKGLVTVKYLIPG